MSPSSRARQTKAQLPQEKEQLRLRAEVINGWKRDTPLLRKRFPQDNLMALYI